jgi:capsular polysaccharide biosynthesis protein
MGEQVVDLRNGAAVLRRYWLAILLVGLLGAVAGAGVPLLRTPMYTSTSEVLLPTPITQTQNTTTDSGTQVQIAGSETVLGPAGAKAAPGLTLKQLKKRVSVSAPSDQTLSFSAQAPTKGGAQFLAYELAKAELAYTAEAAASQKNGQVVALLADIKKQIATLRTQIHAAQGSSSSPNISVLTTQLATLSGQLGVMSTAADPVQGTARILSKFSPATKPGFVSRYVVPIGIGLLAGLILSSAFLILMARRDNRLRSRDQLAEAAGAPVLTSLRGRDARSIGGWHHLLSEYDPEPVDAWPLRQLLRQLPEDSDGRRHVTVVSVDTDLKGASLGPLLASYAASTGVSTELVVGPGVPATSSMGTALRRAAGEEIRSGLLISADEPGDDAELTVVVTAVGSGPGDVDAPGLDGPALVAVSPGTTNARRLASTAMAAEDAGCTLLGVVVVSPDNADRTSGRLLGRGGEGRRDLPLRVPGVTDLRQRGQRR